MFAVQLIRVRRSVSRTPLTPPPPPTTVAIALTTVDLATVNSVPLFGPFVSKVPASSNFLVTHPLVSA